MDTAEAMSNQQFGGRRLNIAVLIGEVNPYTDLIWAGIVERTGKRCQSDCVGRHGDRIWAKAEVDSGAVFPSHLVKK